MCNRLKTYFIAVIFVIFFLFPEKVFGEMVFKFDGIESNPESIEYNQEVKLNFSFEDVNPPKIYYLEAAFKHIDGTRYFGWTKNDREQWYQYEEDALTNFFKFEINESGKSGSLFAKPDYESTYFKGTGKYFLKIYKITEGGSKEGSNAIEITINSPSPTPTPTFTPTPEPTEILPPPDPTSTPTPIPPTATPLPPTPTPTKKLTPTPTIIEKGEVLASSSGAIEENGPFTLGEQQAEGETAETASDKKNYLFPASAGILGLGFIGFSVFSFIKSKETKSVEDKTVV